MPGSSGVEESSTSHSSSGPLVGEYDEVRRRVELLKRQHKEIVEARRAAEEVESIATLKFEEEKHALEAASRQKIRELQKKLKDSLDRSAKARDLHEREKRQLSHKLDAVKQALEEKHASELAQKDEELSEMQEKLDSFEQAMKHLQQLHAEDRMAWEREEEACKGELEKLIEEDKAKLRTEVEEWKAQAENAERMLMEAAAKLKAQGQQVSQKNKVAEDLQQTVDFLSAEREQENEAFEERSKNYENLLEQNREQYNQKLKVMEESYTRKLVQYKQKKNVDLDMLNEEFKKVLLNKDGKIKQLTLRLQQVNAQMQSLNQL